jgi:hypothetical protein
LRADRWHACAQIGALIVDGWAPGLTDGQINATLGPLGIDLPEEARVWWRWHDGTLPGTPPLLKYVAPFRYLLKLQTAAEEYAAAREPMRDAGDPDGLLSPVSEKPVIYFQCAGPRDAPVPVYSQNDYAVAPRPVLASIGELVLTWISYIDCGVFATKADGTWIVGPRPPAPTARPRARGLLTAQSTAP